MKDVKRIILEQPFLAWIEHEQWFHLRKILAQRAKNQQPVCKCSLRWFNLSIPFLFFSFGRAPTGRAFRCKSSALPTVGPVGFPLQSLALGSATLGIQWSVRGLFKVRASFNARFLSLVDEKFTLDHQPNPRNH